MIQINNHDPFTFSPWCTIMIAWILGGLLCAIYTNNGESPIEKRLFIRGCEIIVCIQIAMTILLFLNMYTHVTQWVVWSIPLAIWCSGLDVK